MPETNNASGRTLEEHAYALAQAMQDDVTPSRTVVKFTRKELAEAEARSAAEQRRKDAEGQEPVAYCAELATMRDAETGEYSGWEWRLQDRPFYVPEGSIREYHALYPKPANVAAMEARIAELEGALNRIVATGPDYFSSSGHIACVDIASAPLAAKHVPTLNPIQAMTDAQLSERLKAVESRWDELMNSDDELGGGSPLESMDEEMQSLQNEIARRAALTREGGV